MFHKSCRSISYLAIVVVSTAQNAYATENIVNNDKAVDLPTSNGSPYLSNWFGQDVSIIGSRQISYGPKPVDDVYVEYEYFGRKGPFELYGYVDVPRIFDIGNSHDGGLTNKGSPLFMEHQPRISIDSLLGRSLAIGPFKEWYIAFDWIYDNGRNNQARGNTLYSGFGTDIETHSKIELSANLYARYQFESYGDRNEYSWDGGRLAFKYMAPLASFQNGANLMFIGTTEQDFGSDLNKHDDTRTSDATVFTNIFSYSFTHWRINAVGRYFHNGGNWKDGSTLDFGDGSFRGRSTGWGYYLGVGYQF